MDALYMDTASMTEKCSQCNLASRILFHGQQGTNAVIKTIHRLVYKTMIKKAVLLIVPD